MKIKECNEERWPDEQEHDHDHDHNHHHDDDDALSLSDLPLIQHQSSEKNEEPPLPPQHDFEFDFYRSPSKQSEMRAADEIFFQGQIIPTKCLKPDYPRSESMSSHHSSTSSGSSSSSSTAAAAAAAARNLFHSHPSPSPRIQRKEREIILRNSCVKKSWSWSVFRLGLMAAPPPEIAFRDLKTRCSGKNTGSSGGGGGGGEKKLRAVKAWDLAGGCKKCSVDVAFMKRSASDGEKRRRGDEEDLAAAMNMNKSVNNRTFEWLKQLSIHGAAVGER